MELWGGVVCGGLAAAWLLWLRLGCGCGCVAAAWLLWLLAPFGHASPPACPYVPSTLRKPAAARVVASSPRYPEGREGMW